MNRPATATTPSDLEVQVTRSFTASIERIWDANVRPQIVRRWLTGPDGWTMPTCEIDLRVGGAWRYVWSHPDKASFGTGGVYREVNAPHRLVFTERMDGMPGEALNTMELHQTGGVTTMVMTMKFETMAIRDMALKSGMTGGMETSYVRLEGVLAENLNLAE